MSLISRFSNDFIKSQFATFRFLFSVQDIILIIIYTLIIVKYILLIILVSSGFESFNDVRFILVNIVFW